MSGGYGKPPKSGQFKKGRSGNPKGRPRRVEPVSLTTLFRKVVNETVEIETEHGKKRMTRWEALVRQVQKQALCKNPGAVRLLHQMRKKFPGSAPPIGTFIRLIYEEDMGL